MNTFNIPLPDPIKLQLQQSPVHWQNLLLEIITTFGCQTGTLHFLEEQTALLELKAQIGIPDFLISKLEKIPVGKGMAGIAAERRIPVEMCNLQTDDSGIARPAAKETKVAGSIAVPLLFDEKLYGTLGIAKSTPYDFTKEEIEYLQEIGRKICLCMEAN